MGMSHKIKGHNYGYNYDWIWRCDEKKRCDVKGGVTKKKNVAGKQKNTKAKKDNGRESFGFFSSESPSPFLKKPKQRKCILWKIKYVLLRMKSFKGSTTWFRAFKMSLKPKWSICSYSSTFNFNVTLINKYHSNNKKRFKTFQVQGQIFKSVRKQELRSALNHSRIRLGLITPLILWLRRLRLILTIEYSIFCQFGIN